MIGKHGLAVVCLWLILALGAGCAPVTAPASTTRPVVKLKTTIQPLIGFTPLFIAQEEGFFAQEGLEVEFVTVKGSTEALPLLLQNQVDFTSVGLNTGALNAIGGGGKARFVLGGSQWLREGCTYTGLVAAGPAIEAGRYADMAQVKGRTITLDPVGLNGMPGYLLDQTLKKAGLSAKDLRILSVPLPSTAEALRSGGVDMALISEPWLSRARRDTQARVLVAGQDVMPGAQLGVIVFGPRLLEQRDLAQRVVRAYLKAVRQYREGSTPRNLTIVAKYTSLAPEDLSSTCWPSIPADGRINVDSIMGFQTWAKEQGTLDRILPPADFVDPSFVDFAGHAQ